MNWNDPEVVALLGTALDRVVAWKLTQRYCGPADKPVTRVQVAGQRRVRGIPRVKQEHWWEEDDIAPRLGKDPDAQIAADIGISREAVARKRKLLGIAPPGGRWKRG